VTGKEVRAAWLRGREEAEAQAIANKQSQEALHAQALRYRALSPADRVIVNQVLIDQLGSNDETARFDATALVREFRIAAALPALRKLADWLETQDWPGAPYEWAIVNQLIGELASKSS
jgi:hypothetical protein